MVLQCLVEAEVRDYSTMDPVNGDRSGSPTMLVTDDEMDAADGTDSPTKQINRDKRSGWVSALVFIMRQSYVLSLIAMMVGSFYML